MPIGRNKKKNINTLVNESKVTDRDVRIIKDHTAKTVDEPRELKEEKEETFSFLKNVFLEEVPKKDTGIVGLISGLAAEGEVVEPFLNNISKHRMSDFIEQVLNNKTTFTFTDNEVLVSSQSLLDDGAEVEFL
jgi:hypothetical protein